MSKKQIATLNLSDEDLVNIFILLSDEIEFLQEQASDPDTPFDDKLAIAHDLKMHVPIHRKLEKFFSDADITIKVKRSPSESLKSLGIDTNL